MNVTDRTGFVRDLLPRKAGIAQRLWLVLMLVLCAAQMPVAGQTPNIIRVVTGGTQPPISQPAANVSSGVNHWVALMADGQLQSWGIGPGVINTPTGTGFRGVAAGQDWGVAIDASGNLRPWGINPGTFPSFPNPVLGGFSQVDASLLFWHEVA